MESEKKIYILKQSNGSIWNFLYDKNLGITFKIYEENKWSNYHILTRESTGKYSINLLADDSISVIYESFDKHLVLKIYTNQKWKTYKIFENDNADEIEIYFKTIIYKNNLVLFYSIYNRYSKDLTIVSSSIDNKGILHSSSLIDTFNIEHNILFYPYSSDTDIIYVMYQKKDNIYTLGYKVLDNYSMTWSEFYKIDESSSPFEEYYLLSYKDRFHSIYTKIDKPDTYSLNYYNCITNNYINIIRSKKIYSSSLFISGKYIWCFWIRNNILFSTVSTDEGISFSKPYKTEEIDPLKVYKVSYLSNFLENKNLLFLGEVFALDIHSPKLLVIDNIFGIVYKNTSYSFYLLYFISSFKVSSKISNINFLEKDLLIKEQKDIIENQKNKLISYENKFNSISNLIKSFNENSFQLNEGISLLQDNVEEKGKKLNEFKKMFTEKEIELELLKNELKNTKLQKNTTFDIKKVLAKLFSNLKA